jgi:hypothetical protein
MSTPGNCFRMRSNAGELSIAMLTMLRVADDNQYTPRDPCLSWRAWVHSAVRSRPFNGRFRAAERWLSG